ncbi:hypothetical protein [Spirosoma foliorum]|uniref:Uncharacterized protein n=1 Tax=Spirosoma foliorum TaxID=2710596 RepID=A0A7G5GZN9_9BACT|nr:hypothetical protein [Spirosoma foliorum]QMW04331.1 hypothetical protein H3H32_05120 [Spirosoma foliorum]
MATVKEELRDLKREILRSYNSGGQADLADGTRVTWNQCEDPKYTSQGATRFVYVNVHNDSTGLHKTGHWDTENNCFVD